MHRDIKFMNFLVRSPAEFPQIYLADFGLAMKIDDRHQILPQVGTFCFMAPEVILGEPSDFKQDVWSLGIFLYALLTGNVPFFSEIGKEETCREVVEAELEFKEDSWAGTSSAVRDLISAMLIKD